MSEAEEGWEVLPCGCELGLVSKTFVIQPHSLKCPVYLYVLSEAEKQSKPVTKLEL